MKKINSLITITSITALFVAGCAAVFSVTGIAKLFAGAMLSSAIMAASLELGKIVSISFLYQYWKEIPKTLKIYLTVASMVLMMITSAGIYGYLTAAYAKVAATPLQMTAEVQITQNRIKSIEEDIFRKNTRLTQLLSLRNQQENRLDTLIVKSQTGNTSTVRAAQSGLAQTDKSVSDIQKELSTLSYIRDSLSSISVSKQVEIDTNADIGTFVYIAKVFNVSLDVVVKWFTLIIVLVFDPLAIALVIAVNFLVKHKEPIKENKREEDTNTELLESDVEEISQSTIETTEPIQKPTVPTRRSDPQYYARGDFDWSKRHLWENNPDAVEYYNRNKR